MTVARPFSWSAAATSSAAEAERPSISTTIGMPTAPIASGAASQRNDLALAQKSVGDRYGWAKQASAIAAHVENDRTRSSRGSRFADRRVEQGGHRAREAREAQHQHVAFHVPAHRLGANGVSYQRNREFLF